MAAPDDPKPPRIEVVYALPDRQRVVTLPLRDGMTVMDAIRASGLLDEFPELTGQDPLHLGIYGQAVEDARVLRDGDRVEIYRPLKADPRDQRRRLAAGTRTAGGTTRRGR